MEGCSGLPAREPGLAFLRLSAQASMAYGAIREHPTASLTAEKVSFTVSKESPQHGTKGPSSSERVCEVLILCSSRPSLRTKSRWCVPGPWSTVVAGGPVLGAHPPARVPPLRSPGRSSVSGSSHVPSPACAQGGAQQCPGAA